MPPTIAASSAVFRYCFGTVPLNHTSCRYSGTFPVGSYANPTVGGNPSIFDLNSQVVQAPAEYWYAF